MSADLISKKTRLKFREEMVEFSPHEINMLFEAAELEPFPLYEEPPELGYFRSIIERYYANVLWSDSTSVRKIVKVYEGLIELLDDFASLAENHRPIVNRKLKLIRYMEDEGFTYVYERRQFTSAWLRASFVATSALVKLTEASVLEHVDKARVKIDNQDYAGAITSSYTLVESFIKQMLCQLGVSFNQDEGDIRKLYQAVAEPLNLNPKGENLESYLKSILQGLKSLLMGLYELANKLSDRHARRYNPARHHAKLAVNAAFSLCEFLLESFEYQQRKSHKATGAKR